MIPFNIPPSVGNEIDYIRDVIENRKKSCGDGYYTKICQDWLEDWVGEGTALLTTSGSTSLDMSAILADIEPGDEVILPSFTFTSTATAFANRGAKLVFVDVRPDTMNIDESLIEGAITERTKAVVPVHYAGVSCEMDKIMHIANKHGLFVVEDAAQGVMSAYKGKVLGSFGAIGCYSFHETKNYSMGEGGAVLINEKSLVDRAEIIREKGTDRSRFLRGQVDKYTWVDCGGSYLPSEILAAHLYAQLLKAGEILDNRIETWNAYSAGLEALEAEGLVELPHVPSYCEHNAHMFWIKLKDLEERSEFISYMKNEGVQCSFHYVPLHSSPAGQKYGRFSGEDVYTTTESERLVRLPLWYGMGDKERSTVVKACRSYFGFKA